MKNLALLTALTICIYTSGCEVQSDITKKSLEKYQPTPTPERIVIPEEKIDPADIITADVSLDGPILGVSRTDDKKKINCDKYNQVMVNGSGHEVNIKGACRQIMVNGDSNHVTIVGATEIITNGSGNTVEYSKYVNGKKPIVSDNSGQNSISKAETPPAK